MTELSLTQLREEAQKDLEAFAWIESRYPNHNIVLVPKPREERARNRRRGGRTKGNASDAQRAAASRTWAFARWYSAKEEMDNPILARQKLGEMRHSDPVIYSKLLADFERSQEDEGADLHLANGHD